MTHHELLRDAKAAVDRLFGDPRVPAATTRESLKELRAHIDSLIESVNADLDDDE
jgi:hypothetical protein